MRSYTQGVGIPSPMPPLSRGAVTTEGTVMLQLITDVLTGGVLDAVIDIISWEE